MIDYKNRKLDGMPRADPHAGDDGLPDYKSPGPKPGGNYYTFGVNAPKKHGMHVRPAALLVETAKKFQHEIWVGKPGWVDADYISAKNILNMIGLAGPGEPLVVMVDTTEKGYEGAAAAIRRLFECDFEPDGATQPALQPSVAQLDGAYARPEA